MKDNFKMIYSMVMVKKNYRTAQFMKANFLKDKSMDMESTLIKTNLFIKDFGIKIN